jgi:protein-glutamine gamma-glutamyltransferase
MTAYQVEDFDLSGTLPDREFARRWRDRAQAATERGGLQVGGVLTDPDRATLTRLVDEITGGSAVTASEFAQRAGEWLRRNHAYSLAPRIPPGDGDMLVRWVASREAGHCELFAGSLVLLARTAGFPARVITGFKGGTWNGYSKNFTIRNSDAHAWTEIFDETIGAWLRADPLNAMSGTPSEQLAGEAAIASRLDRSWSARVDSLRVFWYRRIVSFDQQSQQETLRAVKQATETSGRQIRAWMEQGVRAVRGWVTAPWDVRRAGHVIGVLAATVLLTLALREAGRAGWRWLRRRRGGDREDPVRREAGEWLRRLSASSCRIPQAPQVTADLQRLRFGARESWGDSEAVLRRARQVVREARRRNRAN